MKLNVLSKFDPETAKRILAATALARDPRSGSREVVQPYADEIEAVLDEVRSALQIKPGERSAESEKKIDLALSNELSKALLAGRDRREVAGNLGQRGELPIGGYDVEFVTPALSEFKEDKGFVTRMMRHPDLVQHLDDHSPPGERKESVTLLASFFPARRNGSDFWMLVHALRFGTELKVAAVWRLFTQVLSLDGADSPLDLLKMFVDRYGVASETDPKFDGKLVQDYVISGSRNDYIEIRKKTNSGFPKDHLLVETAWTSDRDGRVDAIHVVLAYAIAKQRYVADMTKYR